MKMIWPVITHTKPVLPYLRSVLAIQHTCIHRVMYDKAQIQLQEYCLPISNMHACSVLIMCGNSQIQLHSTYMRIVCT